MDRLVSIVLPVYNGEEFLRESIDSVINQSYLNWELIIIDDCSTDQTQIIAKEYESNDDRIHYFRNEVNLRLPKTLNRGFSFAKGELLTWTSDDNLFHSDAIEKMVACMTSNNVDFVYASCAIIDKDNNIIDYIIVDENSEKKLKGMDSIGACFMYSREVYKSVGDYNPALELVEDIDYWQRTIARFNSGYINEILYDYRFHDNALTSTMKKEVFYTNIIQMISSNRKIYNKTDYLDNYYILKALVFCEKNLNSIKLSDWVSFQKYRLIVFLKKNSKQKISSLLFYLFKR